MKMKYMTGRTFFIKVGIMMLTFMYSLSGNAREYWKVEPSGKSIVWQVEKGVNHSDHIEMAGKHVATVLRYGVRADGSFHINKSLVWPMLRTIPNDTHGSLNRHYTWDVIASTSINGRNVRERVKQIRLNGTLQVESEVNEGLTLQRTYFPSADRPALIEMYCLKNTGKKNVTVELPVADITSTTLAENGAYGTYILKQITYGTSSFRLKPGEERSFAASIVGYRQDRPCSLECKAEEELTKRMANVSKWTDALVLETPDETIDCMFSFCKIRACESIYDTKCGPMHGPGGEAYYAAVWANDQAEYANPFFPFVGYDYANQSAENAYRLFARYMNDGWKKALPSSVIAEGDTCFSVAGDRGDGAMIGYGAARFALAHGNRQVAEKLWPLITWCLEFCHRKLNAEGVVASDTDELERRFPSGEANLCTSSLYYDALLSAAYLAEDLGKGKGLAATYRQQAAQLAKNMERYFAGPVEGFNTYAYYKGNDVLRAWICIPLAMGIYTRAEATIDALFSPRLWTENGLLTQAGDKTFWDRSTLYALRGVLQAGETEKAMEFVERYSHTRLLGEHVPYAVEAWPEGGQRHLSAESALYGRIFTEGLFGIRPVGIHAFNLTPRLPQGWDRMALRKVKAFGKTFDVEVTRLSGKKQMRVVVKCGDKIVLRKNLKQSATIRVHV